MSTFHRPSFHSRPRRRPAWALAVSTLVLIGVAGCATGEVVMLAKTAGGEDVRVPLGRGGPEMTKKDGVQINAASFTLNPEKKIVYVFEFADSRSRALRSVRVEDVSDATAAPLVDDAHPVLSAAGRWHGEAPPLDSSDPRLNWLATLPNSLRVFRFTLTFADGHTLVLHQGALYPAGIKAAVRHAFGQNY